VYLHPGTTQSAVALRKICAQHVGQLVRVRVSGRRARSAGSCALAAPPSAALLLLLLLLL
jgi:hypothetical protein